MKHPEFDSKPESTGKRNPYAVLGIAPFFERAAYDTLKKKETAHGGTLDLRTLPKDVLDDPEIQTALAEWKKLKRGGADATGEDAGGRQEEQRRAFLVTYISDKAAYLHAKKRKEILRKEQQALWTRCGEARTLLPKAAQRSLKPLPETTAQKQDDGETRWTVTHLPDVSNAEQQMTPLMDAISKVLKSKRKPANRAKLVKADQELDQNTKQIDRIEGECMQCNKLMTLLWRTLELERKIFGWEAACDARYRELIVEYKDVVATTSGADPEQIARYREITEAYTALKNATAAERESIARDLVFGQETAAWTSEMREVADGVTRLLAPLFVHEAAPILATSKPCAACDGRGTTTVQSFREYFPVPRVCEQCNGQGRIPDTVLEARKAVAGLLGVKGT